MFVICKSCSKYGKVIEFNTSTNNKQLKQYKSAADLFEDLSFTFNTTKIDGENCDNKQIQSLTMLSITKDSDKCAINAAYYSEEAENSN